jgi:trimeric autotransporter adhesin
MKIRRLFFISILSIFSYPLTSQTPEGFNYQAIARDNGALITNYTLQVRITIQSDSIGGTVFWKELHSGVKTNNYGLFGLIVGIGFRESGLPYFSDIDWSVSPKFIKTEINFNGWKDMGSSRLMTVPYAMVAKDINGTLKKLTVKGATANLEEALFEVKNNLGQTIFAVYNEGVRIYVEDGAKGSKGGFAVGGFDMSKATTNQEYLRVTRDSTRIYVNRNVNKGAKGGFAVGGFDASKGLDDNYISISNKNYFIGTGAGKAVTSGTYNSFMGYQNGYSTTTGSQNVFLGYQSGYSNKTGNANVMIGNMAGNKIVDGIGNTFIGTASGQNSTSGSSNVFLGAGAGMKNSANYNIFIGNFSGYSNTSGTNNLFAGLFAGASNRKGSNNLYLGNTAGWADTIGNNNVFLGNGAGYTNQASNNIIFGYQAGFYSTTGDNNLFIGSQAGAYNQGFNNMFLGYQSGWTNTTGGSNIFLGFQSGFNNSTGMQNAFIGTQAGVSNTTGYNNVFIGTSAGQNNTEGSSNIFIGLQTGNKNTKGSQNTALGFLAGFSNQTGNSNVFIGNNAGYYELLSNRLYISNSSADKNNALIYGEFDNRYLTVNGNLGIGKTSPSVKLDITNGNWDVNNGEGDFRIGDGTYRFKIGVANSGGGAGDVRLNAHGGTDRLILGGGGKDILLVTNANVMPWSDNYSTLGASTNRWSVIYAVNGTIQTSDARMKENINVLKYGLETILNLSPVTYTWKDETGGREHIGLIAQEVRNVISEVVDEGTDPAKTLGINYSELIPVLIKGMQDQQKKIDELEELVKKLISEK